MLKLESIREQMQQAVLPRFYGSVRAVQPSLVQVAGLHLVASIGDRVSIAKGRSKITGEIVSLQGDDAQVLIEGDATGISLGALAQLLPAPTLAPRDDWTGRVIDSIGAALDGRILGRGGQERSYFAQAPAASGRRPMGSRLSTGLAVFDTLLPLARGQRIGLFAGSGVGKSMLLAGLARKVEADVVVIALIGERGRELREFVENTLGPEGMARAVIIAETSDRPALLRRRCAWAAMTVAEHFRDQGKHVLFLADSLTRFAEAHREVALASGEVASDRGFPPSTAYQLMSLAERAGPGPEGKGDITAIFSVLVAGSNMEEPVADILRGTLDGHVVLERSIAERGRFPAVNLVRSVSRSLPKIAGPDENRLIARARTLLGLYAESEMMIRAGLHAPGIDPQLDEAVRLYPDLDAFIAQRSASVEDSFNTLSKLLNKPR